MEWDGRYSTLVRAKSMIDLDGAPLVTGVLTILKQFHPVLTQQFIKFFAQYIRSIVGEGSEAKVPQIPREASKTLHFLEMLCRMGRISRSDIKNVLPPYLLDKFP